MREELVPYALEYYLRGRSGMRQKEEKNEIDYREIEELNVRG